MKDGRKFELENEKLRAEVAALKRELAAYQKKEKEAAGKKGRR